MFTVKGEDLVTISQIYSEISLQDLRRSFRTRNSYLKPFLPQSPDAMRRTKDLNGVGTLTVQCKDLVSYCDVFIAVSEAFYVTCDPGQIYSGTIEGIRGIDPLASERLVSEYQWPISDGSPATSSSAEFTEFSALGI